MPKRGSCLDRPPVRAIKRDFPVKIDSVRAQELERDGQLQKYMFRDANLAVYNSKLYFLSKINNEYVFIGEQLVNGRST